MLSGYLRADSYACRAMDQRTISARGMEFDALEAGSGGRPLLMVHGEMDSNSGTYPMQSERFFSALKGQGATVRLVMPTR